MHKASPIVITYNPGKKSLGQYYNIHLFLWFLGSLLNQCVIFEIFLQFSLPPPYTKLKLGKNSGYTSPTLFVWWGEGLDLCELENTPETQKCPKTFVHDCLKKRWEKRTVLRVFKPVRVFFLGILMKDGNWTNIFRLFGVLWTCFKNSLETNDIHQKLWNLIACALFQRITITLNETQVRHAKELGSWIYDKVRGHLPGNNLLRDVNITVASTQYE